MAKTDAVATAANEKWIVESFTFNGASARLVRVGENGQQLESTEVNLPNITLNSDRKQTAKAVAENPWIDDYSKNLLDLMLAQPVLDTTPGEALVSALSEKVNASKSGKA